MAIVIRGGRLIDPANGVDEVTDLTIVDGRIAALGSAPAGAQVDEEIDARGLIVCPGLVDLNARLREPGAEHKATIASESRAAASAGITTLCVPPDTEPVVDTQAVVELIHRRAADAGMARVEVMGALTVGLKGERLAEMAALKRAGCVGVSNGLQPVTSTEVMRRAMEYAGTFDLGVFLHCEDPWLAVDRQMHGGSVSGRLGIGGIPETAETVTVARDLLLLEQTGVEGHFCHLTSTRAVTMVAEARARGLPLTAGASAYQLHLTEDDVVGFDSQCHVRPPLRSAGDRKGLRAGVRSGVIQAICSAHQPHENDAKQDPFALTEPGISGLETLLPLALDLHHEDGMGLAELLAALTSNPAKIMGVERGALGVGAVADVCIFDLNARWVLEEDTMLSQGHNSPFLGQTLRGRVMHTLLGGKVVHTWTP